MLKNIQQWLSNPKRSYHTGLAYFKRFATPSQKTDFLEYLSSISDDETVDQFDGRLFQFLLVRLKGFEVCRFAKCLFDFNSYWYD